MTGQIYREIHVVPNQNGTLSSFEVWRGSPEEYTPKEVPPGTFRIFELYIYGSGWFKVDQPKFTNSLGSPNPAQDLME